MGTRQSLLALVLVGCAHGPPGAPSATGGSTDATSRSHTEGTPRSTPVPRACRGMLFDLDALPEACKVERGSTASSQGFRAELDPSSSSVRSGNEVQVALVITNATASAIEIAIKPACPALSLAALDSNGARADYVNDECNFGGVCADPRFRIVIEPGGALKKQLTFAARVTRVASDCQEVLAGGLKPGNYRLSVLGSPFKDRAILENLSAPIEVN